jgi:hypothetical protein
MGDYNPEWSPRQSIALSSTDVHSSLTIPSPTEEASTSADVTHGSLYRGENDFLQVPELLVTDDTETLVPSSDGRKSWAFSMDEDVSVENHQK